MELIPPNVCRTAVECAPAHRATLNQRRRKAAVHQLRHYSGPSWATPETLSCLAPNTGVAVIFMGAILLFFFCQYLLHRWKQYKGSHPVASHYVSQRVAAYRKVEHKVHKVWKRHKRRIKKRLLRLRLWYIVFHYRVHRKVARIWTKCKSRGMRYFERVKLAYLRAALFIYRFVPFLRVSAVVIFLHLFMSGDVELHPGPQGEC